jgi:light-regulated signal transduction histidine kinase (bacteriophytochrome)
MHKNGVVRWVRSRGKIFFDSDNHPVRMIGVSQDITEQKEFEEELNKQVLQRTLELQHKNAELERSNQNLEEFAHAASHDLKEPIRKIVFFTDRLKHQLVERLTEEEKITFSRIETSTRRMGDLVDDLLQYSHVSYSRHEKEAIDLNQKVAKVLEDLELDIQQKAAVIDVHPLPTILGYRRQLQQLFQNLISNALKYSKANVPPHIVISAERVSGNATGRILPELKAATDCYKIKVADNGIGFDQANADQIFQMFRRLHGKTEYSGTDVGLAIARKVVENHLGKITAESTPGNGATFTIYLPILPE